MTGWSDMTHDLRDVDREATGWDWLQWYWWPTRRWVQKLDVWWYRHVRRLPEPPPFEKDRVALHFGFVEGVPPCTDGPICAEHGWELSPLIAGQSASEVTAPNDADQSDTIGALTDTTTARSQDIHSPPADGDS